MEHFTSFLLYLNKSNNPGKVNMSNTILHISWPTRLATGPLSLLVSVLIRRRSNMKHNKRVLHADTSSPSHDLSDKTSWRYPDNTAHRDRATCGSIAATNSTQIESKLHTKSERSVDLPSLETESSMRVWNFAIKCLQKLRMYLDWRRFNLGRVCLQSCIVIPNARGLDCVDRCSPSPRRTSFGLHSCISTCKHRSMSSILVVPSNFVMCLHKTLTSSHPTSFTASMLFESSNTWTISLVFCSSKRTWQCTSNSEDSMLEDLPGKE